MRERLLLGVAIAGLVLVLSAEAAGAHAVFVGVPSGVPTNSDVMLTMNVPHERDDTTYNVEVLIAMPTGWTALSCQGKETWTCSVAVVDGRQAVRFTKNPAAPVAEDETFRFTVRTAATAGSYTFPTVQTYNTTEVVRWIGASGSGNPAPALNAFASNAPPPPPTPPTTNPDAPPPTQATTVPTTVPPATTTATTAPTSASAVTTTIVATTSTTSVASTTVIAAPSTTAALPNDGGDDGGDDGGGNGAAIAALVVAGVVIAGAGAWAWRRQSQSRLRNET
jgi:uncharacterized protein YcnI